MVTLNVRDIQGNILRGYRSAAGAHYFVRFRDADSGRAFLRDLLPEITPERDWTTPPAITLNLALTFAGLGALGVDPALLEGLPVAFREPIRERAPRELGDDLCHWREFGQPEPHALVLLATSEPRQEAPTLPERFPQLACAGLWLMERMDAHGVSPPTECQHVEALVNQREHFGFADGLGQPAIEGVSGNLPGQGTPDPDPDTGTWKDVKPGEFILGYPNEDGKPLPDPAAWLLHDGSFMVYRKLEQNVSAFRRVVAGQAEAYAASGLAGSLSPRAAFELMAAKLAGRWRDGQAIELAPSAERDEDLLDRAAPSIDNDFRYGNDESGLRCPVGAHIRRSNPRDVLGDRHPEARRHRIIRRGMPYGPPYEDWDHEGEARPGHDERERGLIFICFNANLERQFEVIQRQWCNNGNDFGLGGAQDFLIGSEAETTLTIGGEPPFFAYRTERLVITRGCEYLLMPGLAALERVAAKPMEGMSLEHIPPHEPRATHHVTERVLEEMRRNYAHAHPMRRGQHPKTHALVDAEFIIEDVPPDLRYGLFDLRDKPSRYEALIRFSASRSGLLRSDAKADAQGMAIKLRGVGGEKILPRERWMETQDFILVNHRSFFLRNANEVSGFARAVTATGSMRSGWSNTELEAAAFFLRHRNMRGAQILWHTLRTRPPNPLELAYWSQTPYALGERVVKYSAQPARPAGAAQAPPQDWDALQDAVERALDPERGSDFSFDFLVQPQVDAAKMPIEDPTRRWLEGDSRFRKVASILIPRQKLPDESVAERLSFTPWHSLPEHRPLGGINRVRRAVYEASSELRHDVNGTAHCEPDATREDCAPRMMDWVTRCLERKR